MPALSFILSTVSANYGVSICDLLDPTENPTDDAVLPRHYAMWLTRVMTGRSNAVVGEIFGGRTAPVVERAVARIDLMATADPTVVAELEALKARVVGQLLHVPPSHITGLMDAIRDFLATESVAVLALRTARETKTQRDRNIAVAALRDAFNSIFSKDYDDDECEQHAA